MAALHHLDATTPHQLVRREAVDALALELDGALRDLATLGFQEVRDGLRVVVLPAPWRARSPRRRRGGRSATRPQHEDHVVVDDLDVVDDRIAWRSLSRERRTSAGSGGHPLRKRERAGEWGRSGRPVAGFGPLGPAGVLLDIVLRVGLDQRPDLILSAVAIQSEPFTYLVPSHTDTNTLLWPEWFAAGELQRGGEALHAHLLELASVMLSDSMPRRTSSPFDDLLSRQPLRVAGSPRP